MYAKQEDIEDLKKQIKKLETKIENMQKMFVEHKRKGHEVARY